MARRTIKKEEATNAVEQNTEMSAQEQQDAEIQAANEQALKDAEKKADDAAIDHALGKDNAEQNKEEEQKEEVTITGPATSHPDMCDPNLFGTIDLNSNGCKDCQKDFPECAEACMALKVHKMATQKSSKPAGTTRTRTPRPEGSVAATGIPAIHGSGSTAQIFALMCRAEGATFAEMQACRRDTGKAQEVKDAALRKLIGEFRNKNGANIVVEGDKYFVKAPVEPAAQPAA